ncbi:uncharacterized protein FFB20_15102 [Fusarium fujikuroi]|nr:uncharacterized protein FFE2_08110 [Fusarium fujikuroi]SCO00915.1 uncharacterized protein FFM5_07435 [Fusarium fujikuroi]SCO16952.1 uncharacterized protein FFB20_15102 [Fusarium fujikuroi]SCO21817.1 uncharacterized protein FFC1_14288 [Fusarium fujikuroi]SCO46317.1 uncharacterized protein FFNC_10803 [Fusarium fujikuroi]
MLSPPRFSLILSAPAIYHQALTSIEVKIASASWQHSGRSDSTVTRLARPLLCRGACVTLSGRMRVSYTTRGVVRRGSIRATLACNYEYELGSKDR